MPRCGRARGRSIVSFSFGLGAFTAVASLGPLAPRAQAQEAPSNWGTGFPAPAPEAPAEAPAKAEAPAAKAEAPAAKAEASEAAAGRPAAPGPKAVGPKKAPGPATSKEPRAANPFGRGTWLLEGGFGTQGRSFFYVVPAGYGGAGGSNLRNYNMLAAPHGFLHAELFPFAGAGDSLVSHVGIEGVVGGSFGLKSNVGGAGGEPPASGVSTTFFHARVGPKVRLLLGSGDKAPLLTAGVDYSRWAFTFDHPYGSLPSFVYQSIRPGLGARVPVGPGALLFEGGYHVVVDAGELGARFPNAGVHGFDAQLGVAVPVAPGVEGRMALNYNRYRSNLRADLSPNASNYTGYIAAGAVDQFFGLNVSVAMAR